MAHERAGFQQRAERDVRPFAGGADLHFQHAPLQAALAHDDLHGPAHQVGVRELHARTLLAVIDGHVGAVRAHGIHDALGGGADLLVLIRIQRDDDDLRRSQRDRPDDAVVVVVLLHHGRKRAADAHAVAAHEEVLLLAVLVQIRGVHGAGILVAQLEDLGDLDAATAIQRGAAFRARVAGLRHAQVRPDIHLEVLALLCAHIVVAVLVRTHHPAVDIAQTEVRVHGYALR